MRGIMPTPANTLTITERPMRFELERSQTEKLVIEASEFKGRQLINLRIFFKADNDEWLPTKKGVTFRREQLDEVIEYLKKIKGA
jgi:hypothetical protein